MTKNILIYADGTGQQGGLRPDQSLSNVYKLFRATRNEPESPIDPAQQLAFYHAGLGTMTDAGLIHLRKWDRIKAFAGAVTGLGISESVTDCYEAILRLYEPGDRIYLFGFSRGAYTARNVAGVLYLCGVPTQDAKGNPLPRSGSALRAIAKEAVRKVYDHGAGWPRQKYEDEREEQGRRFRKKYASGGDENRGLVHPYFIGVFDAVAALGISAMAQLFAFFALASIAFVFSALMANVASSYALLSVNEARLGIFLGLVVLSIALIVKSTLKFIVGFPSKYSLRLHFARWTKKNYDAFLDPRINIVRHALSVDETRRDFDRVVWGSSSFSQTKVADELEQFQQIWFAGNHSDIGGSYSEDESRLSDISLNWMVQEATAVLHPIIVDFPKLNLFPDIAGVQHCEVQSIRDSYANWWPRRFRWSWPTKMRTIAHNSPLHPSILRRFELHRVLKCGVWGPYQPEALRHHDDVARFYA